LKKTGSDERERYHSSQFQSPSLSAYCAAILLKNQRLRSRTEADIVVNVTVTDGRHQDSIELVVCRACACAGIDSRIDLRPPLFVIGSEGQGAAELHRPAFSGQEDSVRAIGESEITGGLDVAPRTSTVELVSWPTNLLRSLNLV
jgi:hypothetical protein